MIKCLAVDDEPYALKQIASYIEKTPFLELSGECRNAFEAMDFLSKEKVDLIFMDINMPEMSGMELVKTLPEGSNIIFTTAYSEYAAESYKVNTIDYLLKPITYENFLKSVNKAKKRIEGSEKPTDDVQDHFFVRSEGKFVKIFYKDILYIESKNEYVVFYLKDKKEVSALMSLKSLISSLPKEYFMRVHRSYIVNLTKINLVERNRIIIDNNTRIPVGDQYKDDFKKFLDNLTI